MRAIALAIFLGLSGVEMAIRGETMASQSDGLNAFYFIAFSIFVGCLLAGT